MKNKILLISVLFFCVNCAQKTHLEIVFKEACKSFINELSSYIWSIDSQYNIKSNDSKEVQERHNKLFVKWQKDLVKAIKSDPKNRWADDALYFICFLNSIDTKKEIQKIEILIKKYPKSSLEPWTRSALKFMLPKEVSSGDMSINIWVRKEFCDYYEVINSSKSRKLAKDTIKKFPKQKSLFKEYLK